MSDSSACLQSLLAAAQFALTRRLRRRRCSHPLFSFAVRIVSLAVAIVSSFLLFLYDERLYILVDCILCDLCLVEIEKIADNESKF